MEGRVNVIVNIDCRINKQYVILIRCTDEANWSLSVYIIYVCLTFMVNWLILKGAKTWRPLSLSSRYKPSNKQNLEVKAAP